MTFYLLNVGTMTLLKFLISSYRVSQSDGFYLETNESDALFLDDIIFKDLTVAEKEELIHQGYHGYVSSP